jgi:tetratricopeptide (TPR) repeat protein
MTTAEAAARLGIRFVVHGALQMSKGQWRLSLEVFDAFLQAPCTTCKYDLDLDHRPELENDIARQIASALNRPLGPVSAERRPRHSKDPLAYAEFMRGYRLSASGDTSLTEKASHHLTNAVMRDPAFALAHATLAQVYASRHFEFDPASVWLEKAEFHCSRALELDPDLPEGHVARAFLLWGPSKNFQHLEAIAELKRALMIRSGVDARPVVLALVEDTISSLASLLLAASIAAAQQGRLHVAHISSPRVWWGGTAGMPVPADMLAEADRAAAGQFRERVGGVLALGAQVEWTFTWTRGMVHHTVTRLVSELLPTAVMLSAPRRQRVSVRRRWPGG